MPRVPLRKAQILVALVRAASVLAGVIPRHLADRLCVLAGLAWHAAAPAARAAVRSNLRQLLQREPTPREVKAVFVYGALNYWDTFGLPHLQPQEVVDLVEAEGWQHLEAALAAGKGAIVVTAHLSSAALLSNLIAAQGYRVMSVVEPVQPPELFQAITGMRAQYGMRLFPLGPVAAREMLGALRRNEVVGLLADRDVLGTGPVVDFCGAPTTFPDGPATLALRTGAALLIAVGWRLPDGRFRGVIEPPLQVRRSGQAREDVRALTAAVAQRLGYHVAAHAVQWTVFQPRWQVPTGNVR